MKRALRGEWYFSKQFDRLDRLLSGVAMSVLDHDQWTELTAHIYSARGDYKKEGLFNWEKKWFKESLPPSPGRILVGGAGTGREVTHLIKMGYQVVAFDPARSFVSNTKKLQGQSSCLAFVQGSYEDIINQGSNTASRLMYTILAHAPYDAVLFGWGSYTHIALESVRVGVLEKCLYLAPGAPVLFSFWMRGDDTQRVRTRAWEAGWKIGKFLTRKRMVFDDDPGDDISGRAGYGHFFSRREIENIAKKAGYEIKRQPPGPYSGVFPHATLMPETRKA